MTSASRPGLLNADHVALIASGISAIVASHDGRGRPSLMRAVGTDIAPRGERITVWLSREASSQLLADLRATQRIAVVFSEPTTNKALQVKSRAVAFRDFQPSDAGILQRYLTAMEGQLSRIGFPVAFARAMLAHRPEDLVAVSFAPEQAYDQTPGAQAGAPLPESAP